MSDKPVVLIVDDQPDNLDVLVNYLANSGLELLVATDGFQALELAAEHRPQLVLLDVMMPGMDGIEVCRRLKADAATRQVVVLFMSALSDTQSKIDGFQAGALDYIAKPLNREEVLARIQAHLTIRQQQQELQRKNEQLEALNRDLQEQIYQRKQAEQALHLAGEKLSTLTRQEAERWGIDAFVGQSKATVELLEEVRSIQLAENTNVLVLGESGTGKELISRAIHFGSERRDKPLVAVNCSAIPAELADAEFFGHVKGAYTGAVNDRHGYFMQANGGTLFLDEIGDMPLPLQAKLLRVLEDGLVTPVGGKQSKQVDVRVVSATNVDLLERVKDKSFRQDLFFRLAAYQIAVPALRQRPGDIAPLVDHFLQRLSVQMGRPVPEVSFDAMDLLNRYHYPGNVRELKNLIEYALIASRGGKILPIHLHFIEPIKTASAYRPPAEQTVDSLPISPERTPGEADVFIEDVGDNEEDEKRILAYLQNHQRINNTEVQNLLAVNHGRASYLLKKLHKEGVLAKQGQRRWSFYTLP